MHGLFHVPARLRLGFILMTELAKADGYLTLRMVAKRMHVSDGYLEEVAAALKSAKLISGHAGPKGGYALAKDPKRISAEQVVLAIEGPMELVACQAGEACPAARACSSKRLWDALRKDVRNALRKRMLADFI